MDRAKKFLDERIKPDLASIQTSIERITKEMEDYGGISLKPEYPVDLGPDFQAICKPTSLHVALMPGLYVQMTEPEGKAYAAERTLLLQQRLAVLRESEAQILEYFNLIDGLVNK